MNRSNSLLQVYQNIYPWRSLNEFFQQIKSTIAYRSEDNSLVAINKPFGVGTYKAVDANVSKQNADRILYELAGRPRYCITDILDPLTQEFNSRSRYFVIKGIDRYISGLTLLTNNENHKEDFMRSISVGKIIRWPAYGFRAITNGYPLIASNKISESVGIEMIEVDDLGDYKEPIVCKNPGFTFRTKGNKRVYRAELTVNKVNRDLSVSLLDLYVSNIRSDFPRCYISSKTAFVLGDVRFSRRIREVMGRRTQVSAFKSSGRYDDNYEPLSSEVRKVLGVRKNCQIPLMLDHNCLRLKNFNKKTKEDLVIKSPFTPIHFALTCQRLNLLDEPFNEAHHEPCEGDDKVLRTNFH